MVGQCEGHLVHEIPSPITSKDSPLGDSAQPSQRKETHAAMENSPSCCMLLQLCYEERIKDLETRNMKLHQDVDELTCRSRQQSNHVSVDREELDYVKERHRQQVMDLEQTVDSLRQQLLRLRANEGVCKFLS